MKTLQEVTIIMAIPKTYQNVLDTMKYIDENGIPSHNQSTKYDYCTFAP